MRKNADDGVPCTSTTWQQLLSKPRISFKYLYCVIFKRGHGFALVVGLQIKTGLGGARCAVDHNIGANAITQTKENQKIVPPESWATTAPVAALHEVPQTRWLEEKNRRRRRLMRQAFHACGACSRMIRPSSFARVGAGRTRTRTRTLCCTMAALRSVRDIGAAGLPDECFRFKTK